MRDANQIDLRSLTPPSGALFTFGLFLVVVLYLSVSSFMLTMMGWQYAASGGSALEKMHPGTLVAAVLLVMSAVARGNPLLAVLETLAAHPLVPLYLLTVAFLISHALFIAGLPFSVFIDTFVAPALMLFLFRDIDNRRGRWLAWTVHAIFFANSLVGIWEYASGERLTPLVVQGEELIDEWRSSALMGHPLENAMLTGTYMVLLLCGGGRDLPVWLKPIVFLTAAAGMVVFGGRAASALVVLFILWHIGRRAYAVFRGETFDVRLVLFAIIGLPALTLLIYMLGEVGFFERFIERLQDDKGSASTRIEMFELFKHFSWPDLIFGPKPSYVGSLMRYYGLDYGIESFWVSMIIWHGILAAGTFFLGLFCFLYELTRTARGSTPVILYFFAVASASLSLSAKTHGLAVIIMIMLILLRESRARAAVAEYAGMPDAVPVNGGSDVHTSGDRPRPLAVA
ncbi:MAG: VpsF family polysaccharide biosynthesis protein [Hyphomicrobium sp.]|nr:VpsF family polysaccharide biosynthesis protein [Hyphomicrobium sp.]